MVSLYLSKMTKKYNKKHPVLKMEECRMDYDVWEKLREIVVSKRRKQRDITMYQNRVKNLKSEIDTLQMQMEKEILETK